MYTNTCYAHTLHQFRYGHLRFAIQEVRAHKTHALSSQPVGASPAAVCHHCITWLEQIPQLCFIGDIIITYWPFIELTDKRRDPARKDANECLVCIAALVRAVICTLYVEVRRTLRADFCAINDYSDIFVERFEAGWHMLPDFAPRHPYVNRMQDHVEHFYPGDENPRHIGFVCSKPISKILVGTSTF